MDPNWKNLALNEKEQTNAYKGTEFGEKIVKPMNADKGDDLPVSAFLGYDDGSFEHGTTEYE